MEKTNISYSYHVCCLFFWGDFFLHIHRIFYPLISWLSKHQFVNPMSILFLFFSKAHTENIAPNLWEEEKNCRKYSQNESWNRVRFSFFSHFRCAPHADSPNLIQFQEKKNIQYAATLKHTKSWIIYVQSSSCLSLWRFFFRKVFA